MRCLHIVHTEHIVHIWARYLLWISRRRHACTWLVLSSSTTTLAIFAHSLIPWPPHSGLFHRFRTHQWDPWDSQWAVGFNVAIENRDIPQFRAIDRSAREPICLFMRSARLRWLAAKKPVDRRRILDSVKLRAKRSPGQGKCGYVRRVVSRGDWLQHMQNSTDNRMNRKTTFSESGNSQKYICWLFWKPEVYQCLHSRAGEWGSSGEDNRRRFVERRTPRRCLICPIKRRRPASSSPVSESFHPLSGWRTTLLMMVRKNEEKEKYLKTHTKETSLNSRRKRRRRRKHWVFERW